ncbi:hypothetical protein SBADM41S_03776 [Streptomyces badius]
MGAAVSAAVQGKDRYESVTTYQASPRANRSRAAAPGEDVPARCARPEALRSVPRGATPGRLSRCRCSPSPTTSSFCGSCSPPHSDGARQRRPRRLTGSCKVTDKGPTRRGPSGCSAPSAGLGASTDRSRTRGAALCWYGRRRRRRFRRRRSGGLLHDLTPRPRPPFRPLGRFLDADLRQLLRVPATRLGIGVRLAVRLVESGQLREEVGTLALDLGQRLFIASARAARAASIRCKISCADMGASYCHRASPGARGQKKRLSRCALLSAGQGAYRWLEALP